VKIKNNNNNIIILNLFNHCGISSFRMNIL
jgi:hypothetical protein